MKTLQTILVGLIFLNLIFLVIFALQDRVGFAILNGVAIVSLFFGLNSLKDLTP